MVFRFDLVGNLADQLSCFVLRFISVKNDSRVRLHLSKINTQNIFEFRMVFRFDLVGNLADQLSCFVCIEKRLCNFTGSLFPDEGRKNQIECFPFRKTGLLCLLVSPNLNAELEFFTFKYTHLLIRIGVIQAEHCTFRQMGHFFGLAEVFQVGVAGIQVVFCQLLSKGRTDFELILLKKLIDFDLIST